MNRLGKVIGLGLLMVLSQFCLANHQSIEVTEIADGLAHPWGMAFLPNGDILITERDGYVRRYSEKDGLSSRFDGTPAVVANNQGGMLDIAVDPDFANNRKVYVCYTRADEASPTNSTAVASATLKGNAFIAVKDIFVSDAKLNNGFHFGCRLAFDRHNHLFISLGDRYKLMQEAQNTDNHVGKIVRIHSDGKPVEDNPFIEGKAPEVYTYGHRNVQGLTIHPTTGDVWAMEHGPKGGDEVNLIESGNNYGWPKITYGIDYNGDIISDKTEMAGMEQPVLQWTPSIAPSGMVFYTGEVFKGWQGDLLVGALKFRHLRRIDMVGNTPGDEFKYLQDRNQRIRDVEVGPKGYIYVLTDDSNGKLLKLSPK